MNIIAAGVTTLDEARYFSAMGVAWLGFNGDRLTPDQIKSIADWIVGPKLFIEVSTVHEDQLFETSNKVHLDAMALPLTAEAPAWYDGLIFRTAPFPSEQASLNKTFNTHLLFRYFDMIEDSTTLEVLQRICSNNTCWLEYDPTLENISALIESLPLKGLLIRCIHNALPDVNVYAEYDAFFETFA